jgi:hypothetical protein
VVYSDYATGRFVPVDSLFNERLNTASPTASEESFGSTVFGALLVAGVSRVVTSIFESKGAIFAPNLFIVSMVIGEVAADLIVKIATGFRPQPPGALFNTTVAQFAIAFPVTILTNCILAIGFGTPFAISSVMLATIASFVALRVAIIAAAALFITLVGVAAVLTA